MSGMFGMLRMLGMGHLMRDRRLVVPGRVGFGPRRTSAAGAERLDKVDAADVRRELQIVV